MSQAQPHPAHMLEYTLPHELPRTPPPVHLSPPEQPLCAPMADVVSGTTASFRYRHKAGWEGAKVWAIPRARQQPRGHGWRAHATHRALGLDCERICHTRAGAWVRPLGESLVGHTCAQSRGPHPVVESLLGPEHQAPTAPARTPPARAPPARVTPVPGPPRTASHPCEHACTISHRSIPARPVQHSPGSTIHP